MYLFYYNKHYHTTPPFQRGKSKVTAMSLLRVRIPTEMTTSSLPGLLGSTRSSHDLIPLCHVLPVACHQGRPEDVYQDVWLMISVMKTNSITKLKQKGARTHLSQTFAGLSSRFVRNFRRVVSGDGSHGQVVPQTPARKRGRRVSCRTEI